MRLTSGAGRLICRPRRRRLIPVPGLFRSSKIPSVLWRSSAGEHIYCMLLIRDLKMTLGGRTLFENASFQVNYGERVALVGPNGAGKTTLFSIILKEKTPDT